MPTGQLQGLLYVEPVHDSNDSRLLIMKSTVLQRAIIRVVAAAITVCNGVTHMCLIILPQNAYMKIAPTLVYAQGDQDYSDNM